MYPAHMRRPSTSASLVAKTSSRSNAHLSQSRTSEAAAPTALTTDSATRAAATALSHTTSKAICTSSSHCNEIVATPVSRSSSAWTTWTRPSFTPCQTSPSHAPAASQKPPNIGSARRVARKAATSSWLVRTCRPGRVDPGLDHQRVRLDHPAVWTNDRARLTGPRSEQLPERGHDVGRSRDRVAAVPVLEDEPAVGCPRVQQRLLGDAAGEWRQRAGATQEALDVVGRVHRGGVGQSGGRDGQGDPAEVARDRLDRHLSRQSVRSSAGRSGPTR